MPRGNAGGDCVSVVNLSLVRTDTENGEPQVGKVIGQTSYLGHLLQDSANNPCCRTFVYPECRKEGGSRQCRTPTRIDDDATQMHEPKRERW